MPCTRAVKTAVFTVHGCVRAAYTAVIGSRTDHVRGPCTAVYTICTRPWAAVYTGRKHGRLHGRKHSRAHGHGRTDHVQTVHGRHRPCTNCVHGRTRAMHKVRPCPEHGCVRSRYVAKHGRVRGLYPTVYVPYTWSCTGCKHGRMYRRRVRVMDGPCTAMYMVRTRPCTRAVKTAVFTVHGRVRAAYTTVIGSRTDHHVTTPNA